MWASSLLPGYRQDAALLLWAKMSVTYQRGVDRNRSGMRKRPKLSVADQYPHLLGEVVDMDLRTVTRGSTQVALWKCRYGHEWSATINKRVAGRGCPYCSGNKTLAGFNDLATKFPAVAAEAHGWDPSHVAPKSDKSLKWRCKVGHTWQATPRDRTRGDGCPYCSGRRVLRGFNDLKTTHPHLSREAVGWKTSTVTAGSHFKAKWQCASGHSWTAPVKDRALRGRGCPFCSRVSLAVGEHDLLTVNPRLAMEADGWDPRLVSAKSNKKMRWRCSRGHTWTVSVNSRSKGSGCPYCANKKLLPGFNDVATTHPEIAAQAHRWNPATVIAGSNMQRTWRCSKGHLWQASSNTRIQGHGCPYCSHHKVSAGFNDLATTHPEIAAQAHRWNPATVTAGSSLRKLEWQCPRGHIFAMTPKVRTRQKQNCPFCAGKQVLKGFNDLATTHPEIAAQAHRWNPATVTAGSSLRKLEWRCPKGHIFAMTPKVRTTQEQNCPFCAGKQVLKGFNDLATTHPEIAAQAHRWNPATVTAGSNKHCSWKCEEGHVWSASPNKRSSGRGCPTCAGSGFDQRKKGWIYLVLDDDRGLLQIGISNTPEARLKTHERNGFDVVLDIRGPQDGLRVRELEGLIIKALKRRGAIFAKSAKLARFDGYTESWLKTSLNVEKISRILTWVHADENEARGTRLAASGKPQGT